MLPKKIAKCFYAAAFGFNNDECSSLSASLAYYTIFALPPLLFLFLTALTTIMSVTTDGGQAEERAKSVVQSQLARLIGNDSASAEIGIILDEINHQGGTWWKTVISLLGIIVGATGVMGCMQDSLNRIFRVHPAKNIDVLKVFFIKRVLSLVMILGFGFLLLVSFVVNALLAMITTPLSQALRLQETMGLMFNESMAFFTVTVMFAIILKYMPDAILHWRDVCLGALITAILFTIGKLGLQIYLSFSNPAAQLGSAAASLAVILIWFYYSAMILLFGAEFTKAWCDLQGHFNPPEPGAVVTVVPAESRLI